MSMKLTHLGHAGFILEDANHCVVIDPFLTGNPLAVTEPQDVKAGHIVLTHGHEDHVGDTQAIAEANGSVIYGAFELIGYFGEHGIAADKLQPANPGGKIETDFGYVALTQAFHSSSYKGHYMGPACGAVVQIGGVTVYHCGDTCLFSDMKLIGEIYRPDVALIPAGDRFTMGPQQAATAAEFIGAKVAIPMHYGTFPIITSDISGFQPSGIEVRIMKPGETWNVG